MNQFMHKLILFFFAVILIHCQLDQSVVTQLEDSIGPEIKLSNQEGYSFSGDFVIVEGVVSDKDNRGGAGRVIDVSLYIGSELKAKAHIAENGAFKIKQNIIDHSYPVIARLEVKDWNNNITVKSLNITRDEGPFANFSIKMKDGKFIFNWDKKDYGKYFLCYTFDNVEPSEFYNHKKLDENEISNDEDLVIHTGRLYKFRLLFEQDEKLQRSHVYTILPLTENTLIPILLPGIREIKLQWPAIAQDIQFDVFRSKSSPGPYLKIADSFTKNQYVDNRVSSETTYYYKIGVSNYSTVQSSPVSGQCSENLMSERFTSYPVYPADSYAIELWGENLILMLSEDQDHGSTYYLNLIDRENLSSYNNYIGESLKIGNEFLTEEEKNIDLYVEGERAFMFTNKKIYEIIRNTDEDSGLQIEPMTIDKKINGEIKSLILCDNFLYLAVEGKDGEFSIVTLKSDENDQYKTQDPTIIYKNDEYGDVMYFEKYSGIMIVVCERGIYIPIMKKFISLDDLFSNNKSSSNQNMGELKLRKIIIRLKDFFEYKVSGFATVSESPIPDITGLVFSANLTTDYSINKFVYCPILQNYPQDMVVSSDGSSIIIVANNEENNSSSIISIDKTSNLLDLNSQVITNETGIKSVMSEIRLTDDYLYGAYGCYGLSRFALDSDGSILKYKFIDTLSSDYEAFRVINYGEKIYLFSNDKENGNSIISTFISNGSININYEDSLFLDNFNIVDICHIGRSVYILASNGNVYKFSLLLGKVKQVYKARVDETEYSKIDLYKDYIVLSNSNKLYTFSVFDDEENRNYNNTFTGLTISSVTKIPEGLLLVGGNKTKLLSDYELGLELKDVSSNSNILFISYGNSGVIAYSRNCTDNEDVVEVYTKPTLENTSSLSLGPSVSYKVDIGINNDDSFNIKKILSIGDYSTFLDKRYGLNIMWGDGILFNLLHTIDMGREISKCKDYNVYGDLIYMAYGSGLCVQDLKK